MRLIPLQNQPNQELIVTIDLVRWVLRFTDCGGVQCVSITRDGVQLLRNSRALAGETLIPYNYLQTGNFVITTLDGDLPAYALFGVSQFLVYLSAEELAALPAPEAASMLLQEGN